MCCDGPVTGACRVAMYLFPAIFFMFNLLYWTYYLIVVNMLDLSLF